jgi:fatty-acid peroxygenase
MPRIPNDRNPDNTMALLFEGYNFISDRCRRFDSDLFETRLLLEKTICMTGPEAARLFYDEELFQRQGAAPKRMQKTLFGTPGVQGLDGEAHRHRKAMFMSLMTPESIRRLAELTSQSWLTDIGEWERHRELVLFDHVRRVLCRAVCEWAGVPLPQEDVERRADEFEAMIDGAGGMGLRFRQGVRARKRVEAWIGGLIEQVRGGAWKPPEDSALGLIAGHRDLDGNLLEPWVAAVEVINVLRPTVAVSRYVVFAALALHRHPENREILQAGGEEDLENFLHEVRRFYPFFPFVAARVRKSFEWKGYFFPEGTRVLLDLYGTNHDPRTWEAPQEFRPERFRRRDINPWNFIPQGGGDHYENHRCAGEWITIELMKVAVRHLCRSMTYEVPMQNLQIRFSRIPAIPESRFVISNVRRCPDPAP